MEMQMKTTVRKHFNATYLAKSDNIKLTRIWSNLDLGYIHTMKYYKLGGNIQITATWKNLDEFQKC